MNTLSPTGRLCTHEPEMQRLTPCRTISAPNPALTKLRDNAVEGQTTMLPVGKFMERLDYASLEARILESWRPSTAPYDVSQYMKD